jgi:preprotein translocase subunit SecA
MSYIESKIWAAHSEKIHLKPLPTGLDAFYKYSLGIILQIVPYRFFFLARAKKILKLDKKYSKLSEEELKNCLLEFREIFILGKEDNRILDETFAAVREVCFRTLKMKPYKVQIAGAIAIEKGFIAEMSTGEGKTLTAVMPAVIAGWRGRGCHIMSSNSYLACRDAEDMAPVYEYCGLKVKSLAPDDNDTAVRKKAYIADITYCTSGDVAADLLRDQLTMGEGNSPLNELLKNVAGIDGYKPAMTVLRGLACAIVDEADSVLIDDAVTPLLISGESRSEEKEKMFLDAKSMAQLFQEEVDYTVNEQYREIIIKSSGYDIIKQESKKLKGVWSGTVRSKELINQALTVKHFFIKDKQYIIDDEKIVIVDEATGRLMPDRFWQSGIHQAVEAKENVAITADKETFARISFQRFFRLYKTLGGMTGTAKESSSELYNYYNLKVVSIPTNRKCIRKKYFDKIYITEQQKWDAVIGEIKRIHKKQQPVLVGTANIKDSEYVSKRLVELKLEHKVLNAVYHAQEAQIVATAGKIESVVIATNMAGRGTDIKLSEKAKKLGGLHVIATEKFGSSRIDRQLYGRCSRQGDPGSAVAIISLDDSLIRKYFRLFKLPVKWLSTIFSFKGRTLFPHFFLIFRTAQFFSVIHGRSQRKNVLKSDDWLKNMLGFAGDEN